MKNIGLLLTAACIAGGAALLPAAPAMADRLGVTVGEDGVSVQYGDYRARGRLIVRPGIVAPGEGVTLIGRGLPPGARLLVAMGRSPARLNRVQVVRANAEGGVFARVRVPDWARPGSDLFFAIQLPYGRTLALSRPVEVAGNTYGNGEDDGNDRVTLTGELLDPSANCPRLAGDDGRIYALAGSLRQFDTGDRVRVTGERADGAICQQRRTIRIERIRSAE